jgi:hypothetical protein
VFNCGLSVSVFFLIEIHSRTAAIGGGMTNHICDAISEGLVEESVLDASLERSLSLLLDAGMFDPLEDQEYTKIGFDAIGSANARELALDASRQAQVRSFQRTG